MKDKICVICIAYIVTRLFRVHIRTYCRCIVELAQCWRKDGSDGSEHGRRRECEFVLGGGGETVREEEEEGWLFMIAPWRHTDGIGFNRV